MRLASVALGLVCGVLVLPGSASAVTCERVGLALVVNMDTNDLTGLRVSSGNIVVTNEVGAPVACAGAASTVGNTGAILVTNPATGSTSGSVIIEDAGDFVGNAVIDGSDP